MSRKAPNVGALLDAETQLKMTQKSLTRMATQADKLKDKEETRAKKAIQKGQIEVARIYAQNAIRSENEHKNLTLLASRISAVVHKVVLARTMATVNGNMKVVNASMLKGLANMNLEQMSRTMDSFEENVANLDVAAGYYEDAANSTTATSVPQEDVDSLLSKMADNVGVELQKDMAGAEAPDTIKNDLAAQEDGLGDRLRALRAQ